MDGEVWLDELLVYLEKTRDQVRDYLTAYLPEIRLIEPEGTYLLWLDCRLLKSDPATEDIPLALVATMLLVS